MLILTIITDVSSNIDLGFSFGGWYWAVPLLLALFALVVWVAKQMEPFEPDPASLGVMSRTIWVNLLAMMVMMVMVGIFANGDEAFHNRMRMERLIAEGKYNQAAKVGKASQATSQQITMLRAFALAKKGLLGEHFFEYPFVREQETLLPDTVGNRTILLSDSIIGSVTKSARARLDYRLIDLLIDKNLELFAQKVQKAYPDSIMPKHYAEALTLYRFLTPKPVPQETKKEEGRKGKKGKKDKKKEEEVVEEEAPTPMQLQLEEFLKLNNQKSKPGICLQLRRRFGKTYWYYYYSS